MTGSIGRQLDGTRARRARPRALAALVAAGLGLTALVACNPPTSLTVNSTANGADANPGDGVCATAGAVCTLQAAFQEGNALGRALIWVPAGTYGHIPLTVTGELRVNWGAPKAVNLTDVAMTVAPGGNLAIEGVTAYEGRDLDPTHGWSLAVQGQAQVRRSYLFGDGGPGLAVAAGGTATVEDSIVASPNTAVTNAGAANLVRTSLWSLDANPVVSTTGGGATHLTSSAVVKGNVFDPAADGTCAGTAPISHGSNRVEVGCGSVPAAGDSTGPSGTSWAINYPTLKVTLASPLVDAVPVGVAGCSTAAKDAYGNPRAVDGNGDGTAACDIGGVERQP
jgi:hypothetical protein